MTLRSQLYLLQLEDYDLNRWEEWCRKNPDREVVEKKGRLKWTIKARILYTLGRVFGLAMAVKIFFMIDWPGKFIIVVLAKTKLKFFHRKLITVGITGSWGKTTCKEKIVVILRTKYRVFATQGNNNTLLGVAKNILWMPRETEIFICEMAAYRPGDIRQICSFVKPKIGIITAIGPMHLERFGTLEAIKKTKEEIWENLPADGLKLGPKDEILDMVAKYFEIDPTANAFDAIIPTVPHRLEIRENNGVVIIDDTYNSNPAGFRLALEKLKKLQGRPKFLITPGMIELEDIQFAENKKIASEAMKICDAIFVVGETNRRAWKEGLKSCQHTYFVRDLEKASATLAKLIKPGAVVLFENDLPDQYF